MVYNNKTINNLAKFPREATKYFFFFFFCYAGEGTPAIPYKDEFQPSNGKPKKYLKSTCSTSCEDESNNLVTSMLITIKTSSNAVRNFQKLYELGGKENIKLTSI